MKPPTPPERPEESERLIEILDGYLTSLQAGRTMGAWACFTHPAELPKTSLAHMV